MEVGDCAFSWSLQQSMVHDAKTRELLEMGTLLSAGSLHNYPSLHPSRALIAGKAGWSHHMTPEHLSSDNWDPSCFPEKLMLAFSFAVLGYGPISCFRGGWKQVSYHIDLGNSCLECIFFAQGSDWWLVPCSMRLDIYSNFPSFPVSWWIIAINIFHKLSFLRDWKLAKPSSRENESNIFLFPWAVLCRLDAVGNEVPGHLLFWVPSAALGNNNQMYYINTIWIRSILSNNVQILSLS